MKKTIPDDVFIASPLDTRHFILDVPVMNEKYQLNAVKFSLKSLYPGNEDSTSVDYSVIKDKVIGIAANLQKIEDIKKSQKKIISPTLLASKIVKEGIVLQYGNDWLEIQNICAGVPQEIKTYSLYQFDICLSELKNIIDKNQKSIMDVIALSYDMHNISVESELNKLGIHVLNIWIKITSKDLYSCKIFEAKKTRSKNLIIWMSFILIVFVLLFVDFSFFKNAQSEKQNYEEIKKEYQKERLASSERETQVIVKEKIIVSNKEAIDSVLSELASVSSSMRILSLNISESSIKFEAEKAMAIHVLEGLSSLHIFKDVVLHQSIPQEDGTEKFVISGTINNE